MKISLTILLTAFLSSAFAQSVDNILNEMTSKINSIKTVSFTLLARERFFDKYHTEKTYFKRMYNPDALYCTQLLPPTNVEVLINEKYNHFALVNPNGFPFINVRMDPYGEKLRDKQHHNIYQAGFQYFSETILHIKQKYGVSWYEMAKLDKTVSVSGNTCFKIDLFDPTYKISDYIINEETTAQQLALKLYICDYHIIELNPSVKDIFQKLKKGTIIKIPSDYAKMITLYIDKSLLIPRKIEVYDDKGLFEEYLFEDITINPKFSNNDFSEL